MHSFRVGDSSLITFPINAISEELLPLNGVDVVVVAVVVVVVAASAAAAAAAAYEAVVYVKMQLVKHRFP